MTNSVSGPVDSEAWITQREKVRTMRMQRHLTVAILAGLALGFLIPATNTLLEAFLIPILVALVLQSIGRGLNAKFGWMWGWIYPEPIRATGFDRLIARVFDADRAGRSNISNGNVISGAVYYEPAGIDADR
jgi:energy-converting hydrogenase Eha subunit A